MVTKFPTKHIAPSPIPPPLNIKITYLSDKQIRIETDRQTNALELAMLANHIVSKQIEIIIQQSTETLRPDRYAKHAFDGDPATERGCGICGRKWDDDLIHDQPESEMSHGA